MTKEEVKDLIRQMVRDGDDSWINGFHRALLEIGQTPLGQVSDNVRDWVATAQAEMRAFGMWSDDDRQNSTH
jgi:hypothetical protein